jgi:hypothetical protein
VLLFRWPGIGHMQGHKGRPKKIPGYVMEGRGYFSCAIHIPGRPSLDTLVMSGIGVD